MKQLRISAPLQPTSLSYYQSIIDSIDIRFIQYLRFFFNTFPENNIFYLLRFCSFNMSQWNETSFSLHVENIKHENNFFQLVAFLLLLTVSLSQRSYTSLFQHVKLCVTIHRRRAILPQTQICKFRRTKFDTHTVLSRHEVLGCLPFDRKCRKFRMEGKW